MTDDYLDVKFDYFAARHAQSIVMREGAALALSALGGPPRDALFV
ncbi:hypothetical protein [Mesorhizobium sp. A556]